VRSVLALDHVGKGVRVAAGDDPDRPVFCAGGSAITSTARRSSSLVPPQTPWTWRVASAYCRHSRRTGQRAQTAFACSICWSAGPEGAMGKNMSGSQSRQAARDCQLAESASAAVVGTEITGSLSLIACWCSRAEAPAGPSLVVFTAAGCCGCGAAARPCGTAGGRVLAAGSARGRGHEGWRRRGPTGACPLRARRGSPCRSRRVRAAT